MRYFISQGLLRPALEVEIEGVPPCLLCGEPVTSPSMDGPLVCGACDCGRNRDGSKWTQEQAEVRHAHRRAKVAEYAQIARLVTKEEHVTRMRREVFAAACAWRDSSRVDRGFLAGTVDACEARMIDAAEAARVTKIHETQVMERTCNHCGHVDRHTQATETDTCGKCGAEANPVQRIVPAPVTEVLTEEGSRVMKMQNWAVSARYADPGSRPSHRRHPSPEDFCGRTVVGPASVSIVEAVLDLLEVPESVRVRIREKDVVRDFVEGKLVPDPAYPHHTNGMHYVSDAPDAQLVEWSIEFTFVTQVTDQGTGDLA